MAEEIKSLRYIIKKKGLNLYLNKNDCFVSELELAYFWLDDEDAYEFIKIVLKNKKEHEVIPVRVTYEILDMSKI